MFNKIITKLPYNCFVKSYSNEATLSHILASSALLTSPKNFHTYYFIKSNPASHISSNNNKRFYAIRTIKTPMFPESISEGEITWSKATGDPVKEDESIGEIETEKVVMPVQAPCDGVIVELLVEDGATVSREQELFKMNDDTISQSVETKKQPTSKLETQDEAEHTSPPPPPQSIPEQRVDKIVPPSDIESLKIGKRSSSPTITENNYRTEKLVKMTRMRRAIARRLKEAQNVCAMLTTFNEVDMTNIMALRKANKEAFYKEHNVKLGFMSAFCKGAAIALMKQPDVNAVIDGDFIVYREYVDISVAVASPKGLVVPVLRNVESMSFADIERMIGEFGKKARDNALSTEDMEGGTFTISNGGVFGSLMGTPIINPPQSAILGLHKIQDRPVALNGQVVIRPMMYLALTYDHRLIDGRDAVMFLKRVKGFVEDPASSFLDL